MNRAKSAVSERPVQVIAGVFMAPPQDRSRSLNARRDTEQ
jgi:hypothetical protein